MVEHPVFVGIDVAKASLDVAVHPTAERWTIAYTERELAGLVPRLTTLQPALVVLEATGGLEGPLVGA
ncbi:MAG: IS110 family transposase, partial [Candidatus Methylomirabilales bacterium]